MGTKTASNPWISIFLDLGKKSIVLVILVCVGIAYIVAGCAPRARVRQETRVEQRTEDRYNERKRDERREDLEDAKTRQQRIDQRNKE